jgi:hypothetical protein
MTASYNEMERELLRCAANLSVDADGATAWKDVPDLERIDFDRLRQVLTESAELLAQARQQREDYLPVRDWFVARITALRRAAALLERRSGNCGDDGLTDLDPALLPSRYEREAARLRALQSKSPGLLQSRAHQKKVEQFKS